MNHVSTRLAHHANARAVITEQRVTTAVNAVDRSIARVWQQFLELLRVKGLTYLDVARRAHAIFADLLPAARQTLDRHLRAIRYGGYNDAASHVAQEVPLEWLAARIVGRLNRAPRHLESVASGAGQTGTVALLEAEQPGLIQLALDALQRLSGLDLRPEDTQELTDEQIRDLFRQVLFPPPPESAVRKILFRTLQGQTWYQALDSNARRARFGPYNLAHTIATGYSLGQTQQEIARSVLPFVDGVRYRARRTARTFGNAIAQATQQHAHEQLGDLVVGYQVHALLDKNTRPAHRERNGRIYYFEPKRGQHGMDEAPNPPLEADGSLAWN